MEAHVAGTEPGHRNAHPFQCFSIQYVQATATIHQDFGQSSAFDNWVDHQSLPPRGGYVCRVIRLVECDGSLRLFQITGVSGATIFTSRLITFNRLLLSTSAKIISVELTLGNHHLLLPYPHLCPTPFPSPWVVSLGTAGSGADTVEWYALGK